MKGYQPIGGASKHNAEENFVLDVSAYRPMLCIAEVRFNDGNPPVYLSRYIDSPVESDNVRESATES
jgi:hypothetical protein